MQVRSGNHHGAVLSVKGEDDQGDRQQDQQQHEVDKEDSVQVVERRRGQCEQGEGKYLQIVPAALFAEEPDRQEDDDEIRRRCDRIVPAELERMVAKEDERCNRHNRTMEVASPPVGRHPGNESDRKQHPREWLKVGKEGNETEQGNAVGQYAQN